jgi:hypothetical protein
MTRGSSFPSTQPKRNLVRLRLWLLPGLLAAICAGFAPPALADTANSANWAGYAVHHSGVSFRKVSGSWRQPNVACTPGVQTYSAYWVGLGGYALDSRALEQTGTEVDCSPKGKTVSSAWYELVPAASKSIRLTVRPGDLVRASVTVNGNKVSIRLRDVTRHHGFHRTFNAPTVDVSSAEWIVEAPSQCFTLDSCQTLPLADFASAKFDSASAKSTTGASGSITDPAWQWTKIRLTPGGHRFAVSHGSGPTVGTASPSSLLAKGTSFDVNYALISAQTIPAIVERRVRLGSDQLVHPTR